VNAVQVVAPGKLKMTSVASRELLPWEVRIAMASTSICGSDMKNFRNPVLVPQIPGHEFSGVIVEVSKEASESFQLGNNVTVFPMLACLQCNDCKCGRYRDCVYKLSLGFQLPGSFAEEVIVDSRFVIHLAEGLSFEQGALIEHLCCGYRVAKEIVAHDIPKSAQIVLIGDGPIALADVQALFLSGYRNMTLIGKYSMRMDIAVRFGVSRVYESSEITPTIGLHDIPSIDVCIMAAPAEQVLQQLLPVLKPGAFVFPQSRIHSQTILSFLEDRGIQMGRAFAYEMSDFSEVMELVKKGKIDTESLVTSRIDLLQLVEDFPSLLEKGMHLKTIIGNEKLHEIVENYRRKAI